MVFDPEHLRRVLVNLLDNARRHASDAAGGDRRCGCRSATTRRRQCCSVVSDGAPIAPEVERYLFEPFFSTRSRGSGLGLYICRELCERYGGSIEYRAPAAADRNEFVVTATSSCRPHAEPAAGRAARRRGQPGTDRCPQCAAESSDDTYRPCPLACSSSTTSPTCARCTN